VDKKYEILGYTIFQHTYLVDAEDEEEAVEKAMASSAEPVATELMEETFELIREVRYHS
jgi:sulfur relay (sulfurtransferase) DsrC/TusE family protein|tara:strand:- start:336 stop:512 length:177 start_codon:yes stop_codon:yes gene_type:complete